MTRDRMEMNSDTALDTIIKTPDALCQHEKALSKFSEHHASLKDDEQAKNGHDFSVMFEEWYEVQKVRQTIEQKTESSTAASSRQPTDPKTPIGAKEPTKRPKEPTKAPTEPPGTRRQEDPTSQPSSSTSSFIIHHSSSSIIRVHSWPRHYYHHN